MNLLTRSLTSQASAQSPTSPPPRPSLHHSSSTKPASSYAQQQMLFHVSDSGSFPLSDRMSKKGQEPSTGGYGGSGLGLGASGAGYGDPFQTSSPATNSFDYYEYFSNYGRLLSTPPSSPDQIYSPPRLEDLSPEQRGPRLGGTRFNIDEPGSAGVGKKFWRRSGPPKYELVAESPEKAYPSHGLQQTSRHPLESPLPDRPPRKLHLNPLDLGHHQQASPPLQTGRSHSRLKRVASSPSSPLSPDRPGVEFVAPPLVSPEMQLGFPGTSMSKELFRISFIETNVYIPRDVHVSPEHLPQQRFHKHLHGEWVFDTVQQLKEHFKPPTTQILVNVEKKAKYPFIIFGSLGHSFDTRSIVPSAATNSLSAELRISDGVYAICGSLTRPGSGLGDDDLALPLGYIISAFQTFPGEDSERLENNWITWTGARILYKYLPNNVGLRRLIFYKRHDLHLLKLHQSEQEKDEIPLITYVLLCECFTLKESQLTMACVVMDQLRARCCGYSGLYINQLH